jgi:hypothetical protein
MQQRPDRAVSNACYSLEGGANRSTVRFPAFDAVSGAYGMRGSSLFHGWGPFLVGLFATLLAAY